MDLHAPGHGKKARIREVSNFIGAASLDSSVTKKMKALNKIIDGGYNVNMVYAKVHPMNMAYYCEGVIYG
jgi:hypothetical protein